jgi:hypothetical protein
LITRDQLALFAQAPFTSTTVGLACVVLATAALELPARATTANAVAQTAVIMAASFTFERWTASAFISLSLLLGLTATAVSSSRGRHTDCRGGLLDQVRDLVWVREHGDVARWDFNGGRAHARGELSFGIGRKCFVVID